MSAPSTTLCRCGDCGHSCSEDSLDTISGLYNGRIAPGDTMPDGQCPKCGGLSWRIEDTSLPDVATHTLRSFASPTNEDRAACAMVALEAYKRAKGESGDTSLVDDMPDFLADLMHACHLQTDDDNAINFEHSLNSARLNYEAEVHDAVG